VATPEKDKNQAVKQQLMKKREQTEAARKALLPGEMVDDAFARGVAASSKWLRANSRNVQAAIVGLVVLGIGYAVYDNMQIKRAEAASAALVKAERAERGRIGTPESQSRPEESEDPTPVFKSMDEKQKAAIAGYRAVIQGYGGSGAAHLARLGEAGVMLDKRDWDGALGAYRALKSTALATADVSVRSRCIEGIGLALEGKKDIDGALSALRELENTDIRGYKELGQYQQARILASRGDTAKDDVRRATDLLKAAREKLRTATTQTPYGERPLYPYLQGQIDDLLRELDPSAVPVAPSRGAMTPEQLQRIQEQLRRSMQQSQEKGPPLPAPAGSR
jgi:hypothetical protein